MERQSEGPTLLDGWMADLGGPKTKSMLDRLDQTIPWPQLAAPLAGMYHNQATGRPNIPVIMMLKCVFLQKWFNLSDPQLEECLLDRISFRRFVGLSQQDHNIDQTSFVRFRKRLLAHGHASTLFDAAVGHLQEKGLIIQEGTLVDATIIEAPRGKTIRDGLGHTKQKAATSTKKHGRAYHGYKAHVATDGNGLITDYVYDTASVHDSKHMDHLIRDEKNAVFGDSAYMSQDRQARLAAAGVFCGIIQRRVRGQKELRPEQKAHNRLCAMFRAMVEHPFAWLKRQSGFRKTRYLGLARNALDFALGAVAINFYRSLSIQEGL